MPELESRTFVIGDIHGAYAALEPLIRRLPLEKEDVLVFLGDYVDGWSESKEVIDYLLELGRTRKCIFIKGNHDAWFQEWLEGALPDPSWLLHGGLSTLESYRGVSAAGALAHLNFLRELRFYHVDASNRLFIHAGFTSPHGPEREHFKSTLTWDRTLWEMALAADEKIPQEAPRFPKRLRLYKEIFLGHTPTTNYDVTVPMRGCNVWNMDTGAAFTGRISAMDVETKECLQSEIVQSLYPNEKGRNII